MKMAGVPGARFACNNKACCVTRSSWSLALLLMTAISAWGQGETQQWQGDVRRYAEKQDWSEAMRIVEREISRSPSDMDVRVWRARILTWSGRLTEAQEEYLAILQVSARDPDTWIGLASVYLRLNKWQEALNALDKAEELDSSRADVHAARGRALRAAGETRGAQREFRKALALDATSGEARDGLRSVRTEPKHELRFGQENDLFNFTTANHYEGITLRSAWCPRWTTSFAGSTYRRGGSDAERFAGSITARSKKWGLLTLGGAGGSDSTLIPGKEAFVDLGRVWKVGEANFLKALEVTYEQHWYWYQSARILALSGNTVLYFPRDCSLSLSAIGVRNGFSGTGVDWRPSGLARVGFPLVVGSRNQLSGNVFLASGTEDFARVDQIGAFASQTYGGGLRFNFTGRQDVTGYASYQKRTQARTDKGFGFSYGIHF